MQNSFKVINMATRTLSLMIIFRWKSRDGLRRQAVSGGKRKIGHEQTFLCLLLCPVLSAFRHLLQSCSRAFVREDDLIAIDEAGGEEIDQCLNPKCLILHMNIGERGSHGGDTQKSADTEGRWEEPCEGLPEPRHVRLWPADTGHE